MSKIINEYKKIDIPTTIDEYRKKDEVEVEEKKVY